MSDSDNSSKTPLILGVVLAMVLAGALVFFFAYRSQVAHVSGMVTLDNQPLGGALVVFISESDPNGTPLAVQTEGDGSYRLIGNTGSGIPTGKYKVMVTKMALKDGTVPSGEKLEQARSKGLLRNILPKAYEDRSTTPLQFDVEGGTVTIDLPLKK